MQRSLRDRSLKARRVLIYCTATACALWLAMQSILDKLRLHCTRYVRRAAFRAAGACMKGLGHKLNLKRTFERYEAASAHYHAQRMAAAGCASHA